MATFFFFFFFVLQGCKCVSLVKLNRTMLSTWYDELPLCMMENSTPMTNKTYWEVLQECKLSIPKFLFQDAFGTLYSSAFANKVRGTCCTEDLPVSERGFDMSVEGFENGKTDTMQRLLLWMSARNMSFISMGDSMNTQIMDAFVFEVQRTRFGTFEAKTPDWFLSNPEVYALLGLTRKDLTYVLRRSRWTPPNITSESASVNPVYLYNINLYWHKRNAEEIRVQQILLPYLCTQHHPNGIVLLANIGHHLDHERVSGQEVMDQHMNNIFLWLHEMARINRLNIVAFRETTPSHFNSPDLDGSYEKWKASPNSNYSYLEPNSWDHTMYHCHSIDRLMNSDAFNQSNTPENLSALRIMRGWGNRLQVDRVPFFKYLAPFYRMKYSHCGGYNRIPIIDCVHYCSNSPPMWAPIWHEIYEMVQRHPFPAEVSPLDPSKMNNEHPHLWDQESQRLLTDLNGTRFYLKRGGLRYAAPDVLSIRLVVPGVDSSVVALSDAELELIPIGRNDSLRFQSTDGLLLQQDNLREIFFIDKGKRRSIPNWSTFLAMHFDLSNVKHVSSRVMDTIPIGEPLPVLKRPRGLRRRSKM